MRKFYSLSLAAMLIFIFNSALSQDSTQVTTLQEVVVSASRTEQPLIEIPRSVTVISAEEIRNSVHQSLGDLLNAQSGLYVVGANQTPGTNQTVFMRGSNSNQVAVLVDGVRITDASSPNAAIDLSEISLANVERIEVIRGSHSTIFGGAAVGGVINLITKKNSAEGFHGDVSWQGGIMDKPSWSSTESLNISYGLRNGLYFGGAIFQQDVKGLNSAEPSESSPSFSSDQDDFQKTDASLKVGFRNEIWDASISFKNVHQYTEIDDGAFSDDDNNYLLFDRKLFQYSTGYKVNPHLRVTLLGSFSDSERFYEDDSSRVAPTTWDKTFSTGTYFGNLQTHEVQLNYKKKNAQGVFGAGLYREKMHFENYFYYNDPAFPFESRINYDSLNPGTTTSYVYAQLVYAIGNVSMTGGARLSRHTTAGNFLTFELNPSYTFGELLLFGSLSTGFNAPSLYQLYDPSKNFSAYTTRGNPALEPERSLSIEVGIKKQFYSGSYLTASAYHTRVRNSVEYIYLWNSETPVSALDFSDDRGDTYINIGEQRVKGIEAEGYIRVSPLFSLLGNVSLLEAGIHADPGDIEEEHTGGHHVQLYNLGIFLEHTVEQDEVVRRPSFTAFSQLRFNVLPDLYVSGTYRYTGKRFDAGYDGLLGPYGALARIEVEPYHLVDLGVNWTATKVLSVAFKIENLLDEDYREVVGFQTRGRSAYLKLAARF